MTLALVALLLTSAPDTPRARLLDERDRITAAMPSIHGPGAMATTGFTFFGGGTTIALLAGLGGTGDVVAMAFFLIGIPTVVAVVGAVLLVIGVWRFVSVVRTRDATQTRLAEIQAELAEWDAPERKPSPQPGVEVLTF